MEARSDLHDRTAVVTGASSGIGEAIATRLATAGARVFALGRRAQPPSVGGGKPSRRFAYASVDLGDDGAVSAYAERLAGEFAGLDILVHSAGVIGRGTVEATPVAELDRQYRINVRAPYLLTQAVLPLLKRREGQVVFVNSSVYGNPRAELAAYACSKYALKALADCLRAEVNSDGVRVLSVHPGRTASPMQAEVHRGEGRRYQPDMLSQPSDVAATVMAALTLPRTSELTDLAVRPMRPG